MSLRSLARGDHNCPTAITGDSGRDIASPDARRIVRLSSGNFSEPKRVLQHPSFEADVDGRGYYVYPENPLVTNGFARHAIRKKDVLMQRTGAGNIVSQNTQRWEDCIIQEVWVADGRSTSVLTEMYRVFHEYYVTVPAVGSYVGWMPFDMSWNRYFVEIIAVDLGGGDHDNYHDVLPNLKTFQDSYQRNQLTLTLKLCRATIPPTGEISFVGA